MMCRTSELLGCLEEEQLAPHYDRNLQCIDDLLIQLLHVCIWRLTCFKVPHHNDPRL